MAIEVRGGGGGVFVPSFISGAESVPSGSPSGSIIELNPPEGQRVLLYKLSTGTAGSQDDVAVVGSIQGQIIKGELDEVSTSGGVFNVGTPRDSGANGTVPYVMLEENETLSVTTDANTSTTIFYQYAFGSVK